MQNSIFLKPITLLGMVLVLMFTSCEKNDAPSVCLNPPCGEINDTSTNLTVLTKNLDDDISDLIITVDDVETTISLDGIDKTNAEFFSCWHVIPNINPQSVVVVGYTLNGEIVVGVINATLVSSNQLVLEITGDTADLNDYEACIDLI